MISNKTSLFTGPNCIYTPIFSFQNDSRDILLYLIVHDVPTVSKNKDFFLATWAVETGSSPGSDNSMRGAYIL